METYYLTFYFQIEAASEESAAGRAREMLDRFREREGVTDPVLVAVGQASPEEEA